MAQLHIDLDHNNFYEDSEKLNLFRVDAKPNNELYWDGEIYFYDIYLDYRPYKTNRYSFKFYFENKDTVAVDGSLIGNPTEDNYIVLDPYDLNSFDDSIQVRNNVFYANRSKYYPVILLKPPRKTQTISVKIYNRQGYLVKKLLDKVRYKINHRYIKWDLTDERGSPVVSDVYSIFYFHGSTLADQKRVVVIR